MGNLKGKFKTEVIHSKSKSSWNVINKKIGEKYKIASVYYIVTGNNYIDLIEKNTALEHAEFISNCFNNKS